jgi:hypothetical protein
MRNINLNEQKIHENLLTALGTYLAKSDASKKLIQLKKSMDDMSFGIRKVDKDNTSPLDKLNQLEKSMSRPKPDKEIAKSVTLKHQKKWNKDLIKRNKEAESTMRGNYKKHKKGWDAQKAQKALDEK